MPRTESPISQGSNSSIIQCHHHSPHHSVQFQHLSNPASSDGPLESLLLNLGLCGSDSRLGIRVIETASILASLESSSLTRADTDAIQISAASRVAVSVAYATASDELRTIAKADVGGSGVVDFELGEGKGRD
jgi:hypothetical protein